MATASIAERSVLVLRHRVVRNLLDATKAPTAFVVDLFPLIAVKFQRQGKAFTDVHPRPSEAMI